MKKLAIIGCGGIGTYHMTHFLGFTDIIELVGFCDLIPERAECFAEETEKGKAFTDYRVMLDEIKPEKVFVCVPPTEHGQIEYDLIDRDIPFFVEKPLALDLDIARDIRDKIKAKGLITASGFQCRYSNLVEPSMKFMDENEVIYLDGTRMGGIPEVPWWNKRSTSGGQIVEQTIHQFDIIRYLYGEPDTVFTFGTKDFIRDIEGFDTESLSTTVVKFKKGALAAISTGCYCQSGSCFDSKIVFSTKDKRAELKILDTFKIIEEKPSAREDSDGFVVKGDGALSSGEKGETIYSQKGDAGILCDRTFIEAVISGDGSKIRSPYDDALRSVEFTLACNESIDTGLPVKIKGE